jgi:hypothetical protein
LNGAPPKFERAGENQRVPVPSDPEIDSELKSSVQEMNVSSVDPGQCRADGPAVRGIPSERGKGRVGEVLIEGCFQRGWLCPRGPFLADALDVIHASLPALAEHAPGLERPQEGETPCTDSLHESIVVRMVERCGNRRGADLPIDLADVVRAESLLQPLASLHGTGVHRAIEADIVDAGRKLVALDHVPVAGFVDVLQLVPGDALDRARSQALCLAVHIVDALGDALHSCATGISGVVRISALMHEHELQRLGKVFRRHDFHSLPMFTDRDIDAGIAEALT